MKAHANLNSIMHRASASQHKKQFFTDLGFIGVGVCLLLYLSLCFFFFQINQNTRPIWYDEVLTYYQVHNRNFSDLIESFGSGVNTLPYLYFIFPWSLGKAVDLDPFWIRLPSLVFAFLTFVILHIYLSRKLSHATVCLGVIASLIYSGEYAQYIAEARPYALYVLLGVIHIWTTERLILSDNKRSWFGNSLAALLFSSTHFVGLVYSGGLAIVAVAMRPQRILSICSSFFWGWVAFFVIHIKVLKAIFSGNSLSVADWMPKPTFTNALLGVDSFMKLVPEVTSTLFLLLVARIIYKGYQGSEFKSEEQVPFQIERNDFFFQYWGLVCLAWILIPLSLRLLASLGFYSLIVPRYFLPSALATSIGIALLTQSIALISRDSTATCNHASQRRWRVIAECLIAICIFISTSKVVLTQSRVSNSLRVDGKEHFDTRVVMPSETGFPWYSVNSMDCFGYYYYHRHDKDRRPTIVAKSRDHAQRWNEFAAEVNFLGSDDLKLKSEPFMLVLENTENAFRYPLRLEDLKDARRNSNAVRSVDNWTLWYVNSTRP